MIVECLNCMKEFDKKPSQITKSPNHFCTKRCAATLNNKKFPKRKPAIKKYCKLCDKVIKNKSIHCTTCDAIERGKKVDNMTIKEVKYNNTQLSSRYARIRCRARYVYSDTDNSCQNCGYDMHVEICHLKAISSFAEDTKISIVNSSSNIIILCRNCHWELDHGLLEL